MSSSCHAVILAGGQGRRLWPWSRKGRFKPFLSISGESSLIEDAIKRALSLVPPDHIHIVGASGLVRDLGPFDWIIEPEARDTAPAIYYATQEILKIDESAIILVLPADQVVLDPDQFRRGLRSTIDAVRLKPDRFWLHGTASPLDTSFGFIVPDCPDSESEIERFVEKPDLEVAEALHAQGALRNTGIFCFNGSFLLDRFAQVLGNDGSQKMPDSGDVPAISIDHFLLNKDEFLKSMMVRKMDYRWSDLGTWQSLREVLKPDIGGNLFVNDFGSSSGIERIAVGDPLLIRSNQVEIESDGSRQIVLIGIDQIKISVGEKVVSIVGNRGSIPESSANNCSDLITFKDEVVDLKTSGLQGGLVAVTADLVLVVSESEMRSDGIREVSDSLAAKSEGDSGERLGRD